MKLQINAFTHILNFIKPGKTELEVSNELEFFMRKQGATAHLLIRSLRVVCVRHCHMVLQQIKMIEKGDFVTLDFGALYNGYISDITRTIAVGKPSEKLVEMYKLY